VGIQVFLAWVAARFLRFKVVAQPWISFVPGWVEISRKRFTAEFFGVVALQDRLVMTLVNITGLLAGTTI